MITLILIITTWYLTKLYYTKSLTIQSPELNEHGMMSAQCSRCSQYIIISQDEMRTPYYCLVCK